MKFQCENCGRSYLAGEDVRGRAFRMRCKQCGHVIVVKPEAGAAQPTPELAPELVPTGQPALAVAKRNPPAEPPPPTEAPAPNAAELLQSAALAGWAGEACRRAKFDPFVDDPPWANGKAHANGKANGHAHDVQVPAIPVARDEAEAAFAALEAELAGEERGEVAPSPALAGSDARPVSESTAAGVLPAEDEVKLGPVELGPVSARRKLPAMRAGLAVLLALGSGAFLVLRSPRPSAPTPQASQPRAAASPPPGAGPDGTAVAPVAPAHAAPAAPRPIEPHPAQAEPARTKASPPAEKHAKPKESALAHAMEVSGSVPAQGPPPVPATAAPRAEPAGKVAPEPATAETPAESAAVARPRPSDPKVIAATVQKHAGLFRACATDAASDEPQLDVAGRRVELILTVSPSGSALYPTLDDVQLGETRLGRCLKDAGKKLQFPPFDGPSERVHVPLTLER